MSPVGDKRIRLNKEGFSSNINYATYSLLAKTKELFVIFKCINLKKKVFSRPHLVVSGPTVEY